VVVNYSAKRACTGVVRRAPRKAFDILHYNLDTSSRFVPDGLETILDAVWRKAHRSVGSSVGVDWVDGEGKDRKGYQVERAQCCASFSSLGNGLRLTSSTLIDQALFDSTLPNTITFNYFLCACKILQKAMNRPGQPRYSAPSKATPNTGTKDIVEK